MSWNDERVELLRKLWNDGLSASQIAAQLGGITRNAVIGKVHRLGLSGRAKSPSSSVPRIRKPRVSTGGGVMRPRKRFSGNNALSPDYARDAGVDLDPLANVVPIGPRVSITELNENTCRWPVGDPGSDEFGYCGAKPKANGVVYCPYHARVAYQPLADRRRARAAQAR
jgi:GcrA cell cycle regulator